MHLGVGYPNISAIIPSRHSLQSSLFPFPLLHRMTNVLHRMLRMWYLVYTLEDNIELRAFHWGPVSVELDPV